MSDIVTAGLEQREDTRAKFAAALIAQAQANVENAEARLHLAQREFAQLTSDVHNDHWLTERMSAASLNGHATVSNGRGF